MRSRPSWAVRPLSARPPYPGKGTTYYVDSARGAVNAAGTSPEAAWKTPARVEKAVLQPGDGTPQRRIKLTSYGIGARPCISGGSDCFDVRGSYWILASVRVSGCGWGGVELRGSYNSATASTWFWTRRKPDGGRNRRASTVPLSRCAAMSLGLPGQIKSNASWGPPVRARCRDWGGIAISARCF